MTAETQTVIAARIRAARLRSGFTLSRISRELDVDVRTVVRWQAPNGQTPSLHNLLRLAELLDCPVSYFLEPEEVAAA